MKKQILVAILFMATGFAVAQQKIQRDRVQMTFSPEKVSATTAMLYYGLKTDNPRLLEDISFVYAGGEKSVVGFITVPDSNVSRLDEYGVILNGSKKGWIKTATFPLRTFVAFVESGLANYINIGNKATPQMDSARYYTHADAVKRGGGSGVTLPRGYCGKDVVVGIVDIGFDFTHRNFYDSTETIFRIKRVWDQNDSSGYNNPRGYPYGREFTTPQDIQAKLFSHDNNSHGSHVAGIAGGGGTTDTSVSRYKGMAPESDLVFVASSSNSSKLYDGIEYIADYAQSVGKPCAINLSWGTTIGPHDGTDWMDLALDYLIDTMHPEGTIVSISASNSGSDSLHLSKTFTAGDNVLRTFVEPLSDKVQFTGWVDVWGEVGQTFSFRVSVYDTSTGTRIDSTMWVQISGNGSYSDYCYNAFYYYSYTDASYENNKPNLSLYMNNSQETDTNLRLLLEISSTQGTLHMWAQSSHGQFSNCGKAWAQSGNTAYTLNSFGQTANTLMVASYNSKEWWHSINQYGQYHYLNSPPIGSRSSFSSIGPGLSPIHKPDVAAPGCVIIASYNYGDTTIFSHDSALVTNVLSNGNHNSYFGIKQGTSMAAPATTGIIALWLEAYPYLTVHQARDIISHTSISDSLTGPIPSAGSDEYGFGKINALAGMQYLLNKIPATPTFTDSVIYICETNAITLTAPAGYAKYIWSNGDTIQSIRVSSQGQYRVQVVSAEGYRSKWSNNVQVMLTNALSVSISGNTSINRGESTILTALGADSYLWSTGETTSSIRVSPMQTTTYWVVGRSYEGCTDSASVVVSVLNAIDMPSEPLFSLYPNPASSYIAVVGEDIAKITIYNMLGEKKDIINPSDDKTVEISLKDFTKGVYVISVKDSLGKTGRRTFVVK